MPPGFGGYGAYGYRAQPQVVNGLVDTLPKPKVKVKNFMWQKMNDRKLDGTLFTKLDGLSKMKDKLDLGALENAFKVPERVKAAPAEG